MRGFDSKENTLVRDVCEQGILTAQGRMRIIINHFFKNRFPKFPNVLLETLNYNS